MTRPAHHRATGARAPRARRRGTIYLAVLALAMLALVLGLGGVMASRTQARAAFETTRAGIARQYAASAANLGRRWIAEDPEWRANHAAGDWITSLPFDQGTISLRATSPAGAINRSSLDPLVFTATGECGVARQKMRLTLTPSPRPLSCLGPVLCAGGTITVDGCTLTAPGLTVSTNGSIILTGGAARVNADVEASGSATGAVYGGARKTGQPYKAIPQIDAVLNEYALIGSPMTYASVPKSGGGAQFRGVLLSPATPLYGAAPQASGVYILDCKGGTVSFREIRVLGTLVLVNCGGLTIDGPIFMSPAAANYPCLIVQGSVATKSDAAVLDESSANANFNPAAAPWPYPGGYANSTQTDQYPCGISGLTYISGNLSTDDDDGWMFGPTVVGGTVYLKNKEVRFFPCPEYAAGPPPGFADVSMIASGAAWEQAVD